ncbi:hypothetical protein D0819_02300 [Bacillus subtilis]|nr:hypothetical protein [Bacillus subtilis]QFY84310.1 hypothetical protein D0819_02300 [Bacillus subtilis]UQZ52114.1 hypothetical protein C2H94_17235 [Bacillus subtilis]UQZ62776.1 hypothetical protein C2H95_10050 [Bacillus subtilis]
MELKIKDSIETSICHNLKPPVRYDRGFLCSEHDLKQKMLIDIWKLGKEEIVSLYCGSVMPK